MFQMTWEAEANADFRVQSVAQPGDTNWTDISAPLNSPDGFYVFEEPAGAETMRIFRIRKVDN